VAVVDDVPAPSASVAASQSLLTVCEYCDAVYRTHVPRRGQVARCRLCGGVLARGSSLRPRELLALTLAAAIVFVIANLSPVMRISFGGLHNEVTAWGAVMSMMQGSSVIVGIVAGMTIIVVPALQIALLGWVLLFAARGRRAPGFAFAMRGLQRIRPWSMTEVFMLAVLVAIVKLSGMLHVTAGAGTYATLALTFLITLIAKRDLRPLWDQTQGGPR